MLPITLQEMTYAFNLLSQVKKPSPRLKTAIAHLEQAICDHVANIRSSTEWVRPKAQ